MTVKTICCYQVTQLMIIIIAISNFMFKRHKCQGNDLLHYHDALSLMAGRRLVVPWLAIARCFQRVNNTVTYDALRCAIGSILTNECGVYALCYRQVLL